MSANDRLRVAVLGVNGRGQDHIKGLMVQTDAEVVMLCDPDLEVAGKRAAEFQETYGKKVAVEQDLRRVFDNKDIDAVTIATPNHWHALATIWACQAGKDVYVEKPGSHNIYEGRKMVEAAHKYNRIVQHGVQLRSSEAIREAVGLLRGGTIGKVYMARGLVYRWRPSIGHKGVETVPAALNYDIWPGPAQMRALLAPHRPLQLALDTGTTATATSATRASTRPTCACGASAWRRFPKKITAMGGKFLFDDDKETPEVLTSTYLYPDQKKMIEFEVRPWCTNHEGGAGVGNIFYGSDGYMVIKGYDTYEVFLGEKREKGPSRTAGGDHFANWIKAVRSRNPADQNGPVETAHLASGLAHLGNISYRLGRQLEFDPATEKFVGDTEADAMLTREYRAPYVVPEKV